LDAPPASLGQPWCACEAVGVSSPHEEEKKKMAHYFVTMDLEPDVYPQLPTDGLARIVRNAILPSVEALVPLRAAKKLVTGGYLVGERRMVFVFEADSEEEVRQMLDGLPLSGAAKKPDIKRMHELGGMHAFDQSS
jgi:hypothetical protein